MTLKSAIKSKAKELGFHLVGVTTPDPPAHFDVYKKWLEAGRQGEMAYLATERALQRRSDPRNILPECRSILVLGVRCPANPASYPGEGETDQGDRGKGQGGASQRSANPRGRVASYAWGGDYHDVLPERMRSLVAFIEALTGHAVPNRWYTDSGPLLEREFAQRAGLGWIGKNTCLINPRAGSYFLLAEILLGIELEPDPPITTDHCGKCTRCLDACPTGCILPDRTIDARRCISYLTIELKGAFPVDLRPQVDDWVFGCDICQQVCPWNQRFATSESDPAFAARPGLPDPDLIEELALSPEAFNEKFKGSPVKRTKRRGYLRNVAVALGSGADSSAIPALSRSLLNDPEPLVRAHAAWSLGQIGGKLAMEPLNQCADTEEDKLVSEEIQAALKDLGSIEHNNFLANPNQSSPL